MNVISRLLITSLLILIFVPSRAQLPPVFNSKEASTVHTVQLNMQDYLWDGIKRDRLVWVGDMHPEVMTINSVFGNNEVVPKSLDLARDLTPLPNWMNGISSYSMWWILIQRDWYNYQGNLDYLKQQKDYLAALLRQLATKIDPSGKETLNGARFLDWPSSENKEAMIYPDYRILFVTLCPNFSCISFSTFCVARKIAGLPDSGFNWVTTTVLYTSSIF